MSNVAGTQKTSSSRQIPNDTDIVIHFIELALMKEALKYITNKQDPVLVEIFARNADNTIKFENKHGVDQPELHTILLYKMPGQDNNQILIIDPSNSEYSRHFVLGNNKLLVACTNNQDYELIAPPIKHIQIYKNDTVNYTVGPNPNQGRDCIDIAVKLGFAIKQMKTTLNDPKNIEKWEPVIQISNDPDIDESIIIKKELARIKQSSEHNIRTVYSSLNQKCIKLLKITQANEILQPLSVNFILQYKTLLEKVKNENDYTILLQKDLNSDNIYSIYCAFSSDIESNFVTYLGDEMQKVDLILI